MIKRYRNHTLQTNRPHIEEEPQITNSHKTRHNTLKRQLKYSKQLYLPRQDDCKTKIVMSMIRKYHFHKLQTSPWRCEEKSHSNHVLPGRQKSKSNKLSLLLQDDCKTRMDPKNAQKHRTITESHNGSNNQ